MVQGVVFDIQRYSIHDGPGIRTNVFLKGCPLKCYWCQNPESQSRQPEVLFDRSKCTRCGACVAVCAVHAVALSEDGAVIDRALCNGCGECVRACPNDARKAVGRLMTVDEVMHHVLRDVKFYENSGGGITLSGGEPTFQPDFALALLKRSKEMGLHTAIETCGYAPWATMERLVEFVDLFLFDIKHLMPERHEEGTGRNNDLILSNARRIAAIKPMMIRVPLIPGFNDAVEEIRATARFCRAELGSVDLELLAYNKLGESKYQRLDRECISSQGRSDEYVRELNAIADEERGKKLRLQSD